MNNIYEINLQNAQPDTDTGRIKEKSPVVEVFSALVEGRNSKITGEAFDKNVEMIRSIGAKAAEDDANAISEINALVKFAIEPKLLESINVLNFMGTFKKIGYRDTPVVHTYKYESIDSRIQASSGDVPFGAFSKTDYPIATQTISSGLAVDYREIEAGNFEGTIAEGIQQVKIDMNNKVVYYAIKKLYDGIQAAGGVKHFAESAGIAKQSVDDMLKVMRRYGKVNIAGDYSVVSQLNEFQGYKTIGATTIPFGSEAVAEEIRKTGIINYYNGAFVTEIPNAINWTKRDGDEYGLYLPQGLMFFIPQGATSPLQMFLRGGLTTMKGADVVTRQHVQRFDLEFGAELVKGMEDQIGILSDSNYALPV